VSSNQNMKGKRQLIFQSRELRMANKIRLEVRIVVLEFMIYSKLGRAN